MKNLLLISILLSSIACKQGEEIYLYDKDDPQYAYFQAQAEEKCIDESKSLNELLKTTEFDNYEVGDIYEYKFKDDKATPNEYYVYLKIEAINANDMTVAFRTTQGGETGENADYSFTEKKFTFEESDALAIYTAVSKGVCAAGDTFLKAKSLSSKSAMIYSFNPGKYRYYTDTDFKTYKQRVGDFYLESGVPTIAVLFNRTITDTIKTESTTTTESFTRISMKNIGDDPEDCKEESYCSFNVAAPVCNITVDPNYYKPGTKTSGTSGWSATQLKSIIQEDC